MGNFMECPICGKEWISYYPDHRSIEPSCTCESKIDKSDKDDEEDNDDN